MTPLVLANPTHRLGAPEGWNHETQGICHTLDVVVRDGAMVSAWQPTPAERERIAAGEPILLHIRCSVHPVVSLTVNDPK